MTHTHRIIIIALTLLVTINLVAARSVPSGSSAPQGVPESASKEFSSARNLVEPLEPDERALVDHAFSLFAEAGIDWSRPDVEFGDKDECLGFGGVYRISMDTVRICRPSIDTLVHELVHAMIETTLEEPDRNEFLELRGLDSWVGADEWDARGAEHAAEIITWAVMEEDITMPWIEEAGDGTTQWTRRLRKIPNSSSAELAVAYEQLTGMLPLRRLAPSTLRYPDVRDAMSPEALR